jgi:hypothetical protein
MNNDGRFSRSIQLCYAHSALVYVVLLCLGAFVIPGWLPPHNPEWSAEQIAAIFRGNQTHIRIGMTMLAIAAPLAWTFAAAISSQLKRIEGANHPLATVQMATATGTVIPTIIPAYLWLALAYRPELTSPAVIQLVNDFCWMVFVAMFPPATLQAVVIGVCVLSDKRTDPVYPRWFGFATLWTAVLFLPGALVPFFKHGAFTWTGLISFWLVATVFFGWYIVLWWLTVRAIKRS